MKFERNQEVVVIDTANVAWLARFYEYLDNDHIKIYLINNGDVIAVPSSRVYALAE